MKLRTVLIPIALLAALAVVTADAAEAAPLSTKAMSKAYFGPRVFVSGGIGVRIPLGRRAYVPRRHYVAPRRHYVAAQPAGYWRTIAEQVWVPGRVIGYDRHGHPVMSAGYHTTVHRQVWVAAPVAIAHRPVIRPRVHVGVGIGTRFRVR